MSRDDRYDVQRAALRLHANDVYDQVAPWAKVSNILEGGWIDPLAFGVGHRFAAAYNDLAVDYASYTGRISTTLTHVALNLQIAADNYGEAEAASRDDISNMGDQF